MNYKKNFFFVTSILVLLSHNAYCAEYRRVVIAQDKEDVDNLRNDLQKLDEALFLFENSIRNVNYKELDDKRLGELLSKAKNFAARIMDTREKVEENGNRMRKYQETLRSKYLMSQEEQCGIIWKLDNMYSKNNALQDLLVMAKRVQNLGL